jgi:glucoamylase
MSLSCKVSRPGRPAWRSVIAASVLALAAALIPSLAGRAPAEASSHGGVAPGGPGQKAVWAAAGKSGFGTAHGTRSKVWYTLQGGRMSEVYYPNLGTPSVRDLDFVVTDGHGLVERVVDASTTVTRLVRRGSLTYRLIDTDTHGRWQLRTTYVTDPARATVLLRVRFASLDGRKYRLYLLYQPALGNNGNDNSGSTRNGALIATGNGLASALVAGTGFTGTSNGYLGTSDGWTDLHAHGRMDWHYTSAPDGDIVQTARLPLTGLPGHASDTLSLGFSTTAAGALAASRASLGQGFGAVANRYAAGWHAYLATLRRPPAVVRTARERQLYTVSEMVLAAMEDKTYRGAFVASPTMPWAWGTGLESPSGAYHLVWARDSYEMATALIAAGDRAAAVRALEYFFHRQQQADGSFPANSTLAGKPVFSALELDEVADPILLDYQLGRTDAADWSHVRRAANFLVSYRADGHRAPWTPEERWENQSGYSPATIAAEIAGLVCAARIASANGRAALARRYLSVADRWQRKVEQWTVTTNGPYSPKPYFLRLSKNGNPDAATTYSLGDSGPSAIDQRRVVDPSFLELVRLGVEPADDPAVRNTLAVVDAQLGVKTPEGMLWHRYTDDGYGETRTGGPWGINPPQTFVTRGRLWVLFAGERGEYDLLAGQPMAARQELATMAAAATPGHLLSEQAWDNHPPAGQPGFRTGAATTSATPLGWTTAQFIRLAWSVQAGRPVEQPAAVACRYAGICSR